jgi:hypothetical protein
MAGGSFFAPGGPHPILSENARAPAPARASAVMIGPAGAPLVTRDEVK